MTTTLQHAIDRLNAVPVDADDPNGEYAYWDDASYRYWASDADDLETLGDRDYSVWCGETQSRKLTPAEVRSLGLDTHGVEEYES